MKKTAATRGAALTAQAVTLSILILFTQVFFSPAWVQAAELDFWRSRALQHTAARPVPAVPPPVSSFGRFDAPTVILIQDVHHNIEAQRNIGEILKKTKDVVIGAEAAAGPFDFKPFRDFPVPGATKNIGDYLLSQNLISAVSWAGLTADLVSPTVGVDDPALYLANVRAYQKAAPTQKEAEVKVAGNLSELEEAVSLLAEHSQKLFRQILGFHRGSITIQNHLSFLGDKNLAGLPNLSVFNRAIGLEKKLNLPQAEKERDMLLAQLAHTKPAEMQKLMTLTQSVTTGQVSPAEFYTALGQIDKKYPALREYVEYLKLSESIDRGQIFVELSTLRQRAIAALPGPDKAVLQQLTQILLTEKLVKFELTPEEWGEFKTSHASAAADEAFKDFYRLAEARNEHMADNLIAALRREKKQTGVLVVGGFHTAGLVPLLHSKGFETVVVTPKFDPASVVSGASYLKTFLRNKSSLVHLFSSEKVTLGDALQHLQPQKTSGPITRSLRSFVLLAAAFAASANLVSAQTHQFVSGSRVETNTPYADVHWPDQTISRVTPQKETTRGQESFVDVPGIGNVSVQSVAAGGIGVAIVALILFAFRGPWTKEQAFQILENNRYFGFRRAARFLFNHPNALKGKDYVRLMRILDKRLFMGATLDLLTSTLVTPRALEKIANAYHKDEENQELIAMTMSRLHRMGMMGKDEIRSFLGHLGPVNSFRDFLWLMPMKTSRLFWAIVIGAGILAAIYSPYLLAFVPMVFGMAGSYGGPKSLKEIIAKMKSNRPRDGFEQFRQALAGFVNKKPSGADAALIAEGLALAEKARRDSKMTKEDAQRYAATAERARKKLNLSAPQVKKSGRGGMVMILLAFLPTFLGAHIPGSSVHSGWVMAFSVSLMLGAVLTLKRASNKQFYINDPKKLIPAALEKGPSEIKAKYNAGGVISHKREVSLEFEGKKAKADEVFFQKKGNETVVVDARFQGKSVLYVLEATDFDAEVLGFLAEEPAAPAQKLIEDEPEPEAPIPVQPKDTEIPVAAVAAKQAPVHLNVNFNKEIAQAFHVAMSLQGSDHFAERLLKSAKNNNTHVAGVLAKIFLHTPHNADEKKQREEIKLREWVVGFFKQVVAGKVGEASHQKAMKGFIAQLVKLKAQRDKEKGGPSSAKLILLLVALTGFALSGGVFNSPVLVMSLMLLIPAFTFSISNGDDEGDENDDDLHREWGMAGVMIIHEILRGWGPLVASRVSLEEALTAYANVELGGNVNFDPLDNTRIQDELHAVEREYPDFAVLRSLLVDPEVNMFYQTVMRIFWWAQLQGKEKLDYSIRESSEAAMRMIVEKHIKVLQEIAHHDPVFSEILETIVLMLGPDHLQTAVFKLPNLEERRERATGHKFMLLKAVHPEYTDNGIKIIEDLKMDAPFHPFYTQLMHKLERIYIVYDRRVRETNLAFDLRMATHNKAIGIKEATIRINPEIPLAAQYYSVMDQLFRILVTTDILAKYPLSLRSQTFFASPYIRWRAMSRFLLAQLQTGLARETIEATAKLVVNEAESVRSKSAPYMKHKSKGLYEEIQADVASLTSRQIDPEETIKVITFSPGEPVSFYEKKPVFENIIAKAKFLAAKSEKLLAGWSGKIFLVAVLFVGMGANGGAVLGIVTLITIFGSIYLARKIHDKKINKKTFPSLETNDLKTWRNERPSLLETGDLGVHNVQELKQLLENQPHYRDVLKSRMTGIVNQIDKGGHVLLMGINDVSEFRDLLRQYGVASDFSGKNIKTSAEGVADPIVIFNAYGESYDRIRIFAIDDKYWDYKQGINEGFDWSRLVVEVFDLTSGMTTDVTSQIRGALESLRAA